jgi:hypothetical protein
MSVPVVLRSRVEQDLRSARDWYDVRQEGLGDEFLTQVYPMFERLGQLPEIYPIIWKDNRKCRLTQFPYAVYFRAFTDRVEV